MEKITSVERYVFHVSHPKNRLSILKKGLLGNINHSFNVRGAVFAHKDIEPSIHWCTMNLDCLAMPMIQFVNCLEAYDYWRIDTQLINNNWYTDYAAQNDFADILGYNPKDNYVYTDMDVSLRAITLFRFQNDEFWDFSGENGAYHFRSVGEFRPFKTL